VSKRKVLCIIDVYNWAMHNRFLALEKYFGHEFVFNVILAKELNKNHFKNHDIVYSLNWVLHKHIQKHIPKNRKFKLVTTVCSHGKGGGTNKLRGVLREYDRISASSAFLYKQLKHNYDNVIYTPFGVDREVFKKITVPSSYQDKFGFVGKTNRPLKRFRDIKRAVENNRFKLSVVSHTSNFDKDQMVNFYNRIGTLICYSESEGTPNPVLEAASCGRAVISTKVGNVPELFGKRYPLKPVGNKADLEWQIKQLSKNKRLLDECGRYLERRIAHTWSWDKRVSSFGSLLS